MDTSTEQSSSPAALTAAVELIDATRIEDGRYAYYAEEAAEWYLTDEDDLIDLGERLSRGDPDAYSHWCAGSSAQPVSDLDHDTLDMIADVGRAVTYRCQCGDWDGEPCSVVCPATDLVTVRWVAESERGSAESSGTGIYGAYAETSYVSRRCADYMVDSQETDEDGEPTGPTEGELGWVRIVGPTYE